MNKKVALILVVVLAVALLFVGCGENYNHKVEDYVDYSDETVIGNGGIAVKQGNYLYFINGVSSYTADNTFGKVIKGAVMRYEIDGAGNINFDTLTTVVPKTVFSSSPNAGIYVYGEWIYYVTPAGEVDRNGNALTDYVNFMRTKTDGTSTEKLLRVKGNDVEYAFSHNALVYYLDGVLYSAKLEKNTTPVMITDEATDYVFAHSMDYNPSATTKNADSYVYYTKASETSTDTNNELWVAGFDFAETNYNEQVIGKFSYMTDAEKEAFDDLDNDTTDVYNDKMFKISIISYDDGLLYYTKTITNGSSTQVVGTYSYDMAGYLNMSEPKFDGANEIKYSSLSYSTIYQTGVAGEVMVGDGSKYYILKDGQFDRICFSSNVTVLDVFDGYMYYTSSSKVICKFKLDGTEYAQTLTESVPDTSYLKCEIMLGKLYFVNPDYKYVYVTDLNEDSVDKMLGDYNEADQEAVDELNGDEE